MPTDEAPSGPHDAAESAPPRAPGSVRRTSTIDTVRPEGWTGPSYVDARARDLLTDPSGDASVVGEARITARLNGFPHTLEEIETAPELPVVQSLLGAVVGPGFRAKVDAAWPEGREGGTLLYLLLDDMPGAALVSGYSMLKAGLIPDRPPEQHDEFIDARSDLCAGWAADGFMMTTIRLTGRNPVPAGPGAPDLFAADPLGFHQVAPLQPMGMRRLRRIDLTTPGDDGRCDVDAFFRDTHVDADGVETVVHEYRVAATIDAATRTFGDVSAAADVLPWVECPGALGSAARLSGRSLQGLRPWVRQEFTGTTTCTHLNDTLRGLQDAGALLDVLQAAERAVR